MLVFKQFDTRANQSQSIFGDISAFEFGHDDGNDLAIAFNILPFISFLR
jgi:hypothetical protein